MTTNNFSLVEEKCGIIFASCPALRQFVAYRRRVGTFFPSKQRQAPEQDFVRFRRRVNLRDIFWYRKASLTEGRVLGPQRTFYAPSDPSVSDQISSATAAKKSVLDVWFERLMYPFSSMRDSSDHSRGSSRLRHKFRGKFSDWSTLRSNESARNARLDMSAERGQGWPGLGSNPAENGLAHRLDSLETGGVGGNREKDSGSRASGDKNGSMEEGLPQRVSQDITFAEALANPFGSQAS